MNTSLPQRDQTKEIIPKIKKLLEENHLSLEQLEGIAVCTGPGLFTGTRIGVMTAKTLSYASDIPLYPFSTFDLFSEKEPYAVLDAKCGRAHLLYQEKVALILHEDLNTIKEKIYSLDPSPFKHLNMPLEHAFKEIKTLLPILLNKKPVSHKEIEVFYPEES